MDLDNIKDSELLFGDDTEDVVPPALLVSAPVLDISFHPQLPIFAVGVVTGEVEIYEYHGNEIVKKPLVNDFSSWVFGRNKMYSEEEVVVSHHNHNMRMHPTGSVSAMEFTDDGSYLVTASSDRTISVLDCVSARLVIHIAADEVKQKTEKGKKLNAMNKKAPPSQGKPQKARKMYTVTPNPHKYGISAMNVCDENLVATGDDDGLIAIWDMRERKPAHTYHEHGDYVSQLCYFTDVSELVSSSGDTCLGCYDVRAGKIRDFSERRKDEINCFAFINSTAVSNASFIPSILCGTPTGSLPMWKYGSWRRPYDVMEYHPRECESIIAFHGDGSTFNHNMVLTGACDGLVRVLQMYPVRRNVCQISARDYTYSHQNASLNNGNTSGNFIVRKGRGHEGISKMRVSHDGNVLAVSGSDNIIDFVDIRFLNDQKLLDKLRGKAERRHLDTLRRMEAEANEKERAQSEPQALPQEDHITTASPATEDVKDSTAPDKTSKTSKKLKAKATSGATAHKDDDSDDDDDAKSSGGDSSGSEPTEADKQQSVAMKEKLIALLKERAAMKKRAREERERLEAMRADETSTSASSDDDDGGTNKRTNNRKQERGESNSDFDSSDDADMFSSDDEVATARKQRQLRAKRAKQSGELEPQRAVAGVREGKTRKQETARPAAGTVKPKGTAGSTDGATPDHEANAKAAMDEYQATRQERRERVAAAKWLKQEKKKKINFTYEKRRRRVGGFFGDMVNTE